MKWGAAQFIKKLWKGTLSLKRLRATALHLKEVNRIQICTWGNRGIAINGSILMNIFNSTSMQIVRAEPLTSLGSKRSVGARSKTTTLQSKFYILTLRHNPKPIFRTSQVIFFDELFLIQNSRYCSKHNR